MDYEAKHLEALQKMEAKSAIGVSFRSEVPGIYDPITDTNLPPTVSTVDGLAIEIPGDPEVYEMLELILQSPITLFFVPYTFGQEPALNNLVLWSNADRVVKALLPIRPDGRLLAVRAIVV